MGLLSSLFGGSKTDGNQTGQDEKNFEILKYDGIRARNMGQLAYAIKCFESAVALNDEPETLGLLANAYLQTGHLEDARHTLERLTVKDATNLSAWLALANVCYMQEDYATMNDVCQKALALDDKNATVYYQSARAAKGLKNDLQAVVLLTKALVQDDGFVNAYLLRAEILWEMRQAKDAKEDIQKVLQLSPDSEEALLLNGKIDAALGNVEAALQGIDHVISLNPFHEEGYLLKAGIFLLQKDFDKAIDTYTEAMELMEDNARLYQERGRVYLLKGDKEKAAADLKRAIELNPESENLITGNFKNYEAKNG